MCTTNMKKGIISSCCNAVFLPDYCPPTQVSNGNKCVAYKHCMTVFLNVLLLAQKLYKMKICILLA